MQNVSLNRICRQENNKYGQNSETARRRDAKKKDELGKFRVDAIVYEVV